MQDEFHFRIDATSGVPFYRQVIDSILIGLSGGALKPGQRLPTVRQAAVDLSINPNTVVRAYRELEIRGIVTTQQGTGTFITPQSAEPSSKEAKEQRRKQLDLLVSEFLSRAGAAGFRMEEVWSVLKERGK